MSLLWYELLNFGLDILGDIESEKVEELADGALQFNCLYIILKVFNLLF
jgi:hypothetical protein